MLRFHDPEKSRSKPQPLEFNAPHALLQAILGDYRLNFCAAGRHCAPCLKPKLLRNNTQA